MRLCHYKTIKTFIFLKVVTNRVTIILCCGDKMGIKSTEPDNTLLCLSYRLVGRLLFCMRCLL